MFAAGQNGMGVIVVCVAVCLLECGCSTVQPLNYTVAVMNEGREGIRLMPFRLADTPDTTVAVGEALPGGRASMSPYYCRPKSSLTLAWCFLKTGEKRQAAAVVELPEEFTRERGSAIVFHIKPDDNTVDVTYEILDLRTGRMRIIRQEERSNR